MKSSSLLHSIGVGLLSLLLALVGYEAYGAYMLNHTYYYSMFSATNRWIIVWMIVSALVPLTVIFISKSFNFKNTMIGFALGLIVSGYAHTALKGGLVGSAGLFLFTFNTLFLIVLATIFIVGLYCIGAKIYHLFLKQKIQHWYDVLFSLGFGLAVFVVINYLLIACNIFYPIFAWIQLGAAVYLIIQSKEIRTQAHTVINQSGSFFLSNSSWVLPFTLLLGISIVYVYLGFNLSFIPYSTAWDANHAYMYIPKIMANNYGMRLDQGAVGGSNLWMVYVAYWFSLMKPLAPGFTLAPDTVAVVMNFLSGPLSLLFGLGALRKAIDYFMPQAGQNTSKNLAFGLGWMYFLLWVMSGMGAFLVFVDNKTDLGVMSLSMLALMSGFIFFEHVGDPDKHNEREVGYMKDITQYALFSGLFFALATMAKPTAFQDILIFGLLSLGIWAGVVGAIAGFLLVLGILGRAETMSIIYYISKPLATKFLGFGGVLLSIEAGLINMKNKSRNFLKPLLIWAATIVSVLLVLKGPFLIVSQLQSNTFTPSNFVKSLLMSYGGDTKDNKKNNEAEKKSAVLFAQTGSGGLVSSGYSTPIQYQPTIAPKMCSLSAVSKTKETLFEGICEVRGGGLEEDLGRYIGFGQREFTAPTTRTLAEKRGYGSIRLGYHILRLFYHTPGCYSKDLLAKKLCEDRSLIERFDISRIKSLQSGLDKESRGYSILSGVMNNYTQLGTSDCFPTQDVFVQNTQQDLKKYMEGNVTEIKRDKEGNISIAIPYAYLTPLNVIFNRSLQNLSSYYTDIGFVWILSLLLLLVGLLYTGYHVIKSLIYKYPDAYYKLFVLHIVTVAGWVIRWFIASGIIWYAVGLIAWTIFSNVLFLANLLPSQSKDKESSGFVWILVALLVFVFIVQTLLNLFRIASQGGEGPFVWYKGNTAKEQIYEFNTQGFAPVEKIDHGYRMQDVFDLQFGIYNSFINTVKDRPDSDGVMIAGTYIQYFLHNQNNLVSDGLLTEFWKRGVNGDSCLAAQRLKDKKVKYLVIDPNVGSVGGSTLIDRFIAKIDPKTNKIVTHGAATMLAKMTKEGYLKLISTNTIGAKYAYTMTDDELRSIIVSIQDSGVRTSLQNAFDNDSLLFRAKLALPRYFGEEANNYFVLIATILEHRMANSVGISDIADIFGKVIDTNKVSLLISKMLQRNISPQDMVSANKNLTKDEKVVLGYYISLIQLQQSGKTQEIQQALRNLLQQSLGGGSQVIIFELTI